MKIFNLPFLLFNLAAAVAAADEVWIDKKQVDAKFLYHASNKNCVALSQIEKQVIGRGTPDGKLALLRGDYSGAVEIVPREALPVGF